MPTSQKTFRVFVSSTFTDMRAERRILQEKVFPDLKRYCEARGASFQAVDLRWGVNEESQREQRTMEICLTEIARCQRLSPRPNFIVLLGDRYGWQPVPNKIPSTEMDNLRPHLTDTKNKLIDDWYKEDTNAIPAEYVLQPRGEEYHDYQNWQPVEDRLRRALRQAVDQTNFSSEKRIKYFASATHQEIINGALQPQVGGFDPADHVFAYLRKIDPPPTGPKAGDYLDLLPNRTVDPYAKAQMDRLKEELGGTEEDPGGKLPEDHIHRYKAEWKEGVLFEDGVLDDFVARVFQDLKSVIDQELPKITAPDELTREKELQADFAQRLTRFFTGQEEPRRRIAEYLKHGSGKTLAVIGFSGSGKSSIMAQALQDSDALGTIIYRFIGSTSASSNPLLMLRQVCEEIAGAYDTSLSVLRKEGEDQKKLATHNELSEIFSRCLDLATESQPLFIFLDALDQLQDQYVGFLPHNLPDNVRLVVSALPELEDRLSFTEVYSLPLMTVEDGKALLAKWLAEKKRKLTEEQWHEVIDRFKENKLPLYLKLAFEQARQWHSYDLEKFLPAEVEDILAEYFGLLEKEHTPELAGKVAGNLLSGKYQGLTETEVIDLLVFDGEYWEDFVKRSHPDHQGEIEELGRLPFVVWSRLFLELEPYLTERDADGFPVISFYHRQFKEFAEKRYLRTDKVQRKFQATLAGYFETLPPYLDEAEKKPNVRKVVEQPYQETMAGRWQALADKCLANFPFLMAKAKAALVEDLLEDYRLAFTKLPQEWRGRLKYWEAFFRERAHILRRGNDEWPAHKILLQLAVEHATDSPVTMGAEDYLSAGKCGWPWLRRKWRLQHVGIDPCLAVLEGHSSEVKSALRLLDGRILSWSGDKTLRIWGRDGQPLSVLAGHTSVVEGALALPDRRILSWSWDRTLRLWDREGQPLSVLAGHTAGVKGALVLPDGRILSWSDDHTLRLWDREGQPLSVLAGHTAGVKGALVLPDGRILTWSWDHTLRLWDREGQPLAVLEGHTSWVKGALALPDGRILSWSADNTLRLWGRDGQPLAVLAGHAKWVEGALVLPDGRILSWSGDGDLGLWDREGKTLAWLRGHRSMVLGALVFPKKRILSWSNDNTLRFWDLKKGQPLAILEGHTLSVMGALVLPDGRILSWSGDKTLRFWDLKKAQPLAILEGHTVCVTGALVLPDGRILSWSGDKTLRLWGREGQLLTVSEGHSSWVNGAQVFTDGRILSWDKDWISGRLCFRLWDREGQPLVVPWEYYDKVLGAIGLPDGRILSWSGDECGSFKLWDQKGQPLAELRGHYSKVLGALVLPDGRILSWDRSTLRIWDRGGQPLAALEGHTSWVRGALALPDGRILSWSDDNTLRLWGREGQPLAVLEGHTSWVKDALALPDGRILSWSDDNTLRLWYREGQPLAVLSGHTALVEGAIGLPDGRILSWSRDKTFRLWDGDGSSLGVSLEEDQRLYPEAWSALYGSDCVCGEAYVTDKDNLTILGGKQFPDLFWHGASECTSRLLWPDGRAVVTQANGQVCVLQLYYGSQPMTLDDLEAMAPTVSGIHDNGDSPGSRTPETTF